jgi:mRNA interferase HigB
MKRIFSKSTLIAFWNKHPETEQYVKTWYDSVLKADWQTPNDVKKTFGSASILKRNRVVFNIKGNKFRLIAKINYEKQWLFILFVGTHNEYDKIDVDNV